MKGFSLIEVLIFVSVIAVFFVVAAAVSISSLRNVSFNEHKILATHYSEELLAWLMSQKEIDWNQFVQQTNSASVNNCAVVTDCTPLTYCFNTTPIVINGFSSWQSGQCSSLGLNPAIYKRELSLSIKGCQPSVTLMCQVSQVNVSINTRWNDVGIGATVPIDTVFSIWEK